MMMIKMMMIMTMTQGLLSGYKQSYKEVYTDTEVQWRMEEYLRLTVWAGSTFLTPHHCYN